jgi:hypothetical protein
VDLLHCFFLFDGILLLPSPQSLSAFFLHSSHFCSPESVC